MLHCILLSGEVAEWSNAPDSTVATVRKRAPLTDRLVPRRSGSAVGAGLGHVKPFVRYPSLNAPANHQKFLSSSVIPSSILRLVGPSGVAGAGFPGLMLTLPKTSANTSSPVVGNPDILGRPRKTRSVQHLFSFPLAGVEFFGRADRRTFIDKI
jgi:hypothetical protein